MVHPLRLRLCIRIPMKRKSYTCISDFSWKSPGFFFFFFKRKQNAFDKNQALRYFSEKKHCLPLFTLFDSLQQNLTFKTSLSDELLFCSEDPIFVWEEHYFVILL